MRKLKSLITAISFLFLLPVFFGNFLIAQEGNVEEKDSDKAEVKERAEHRSELRGPFAFYHRIPDVTKEQVESIKKIRLGMLQEISALRNQINELEQRLVTLTSVENVDLATVDDTIDELYLLHASNRKVIEHVKQKIRALLTDEQRMWFDQQFRKDKRIKGKQKHIKQGEPREKRMERSERKLHEQKKRGERN